MIRRMIATFAAAGLLAAPALADSDQPKLAERLNQSAAVISEIMSVPDKAIPNQITQQATCVAVIPSMKKGAFVVGAQYGQGVVTCRTDHGWSAPAFIRVSGGSFGFQIGGQATDLVMVAVNQKGMQDLLKNKFKIGGDAAASAGPVGRNTQAGTDWKLSAELLTWSRSKGLFAGIDLTGDVVDQNGDDTKTFYGADTPFETILGGSVATPADAQPFVKMVSRYFRVARADTGK